MDIIKDKNKLKKNNFFIFISKTNKLEPINFKLNVKYSDLLEISDQKKVILKNTECFLEGRQSNNILLWGAKGMGKSTLVKCIINYFNEEKKKEIKLIEVFNNNVDYLINIVHQLSRFKYKFVIFIDDISFKNNDNDFRLFKTLVEGSLLSHVNNVKYYITSNLRHLSHKETSGVSNDIEAKEANQNLISLSDRFGSWVGFYDSNQEKYLNMVKHYLKKSSIKYSKSVEKKALSWSIEKGNFSGRTAQQFVKNIEIYKAY